VTTHIDISPFSLLPSGIAKDIRTRQITVAEVVKFAEVHPAMEERATTEFLNTIQKPESFSDSQLWTAQDRRLMLMWVWLQTTDDTTRPVSYDCNHCSQKHAWRQDYRELASKYRPIQGKPEREISVTVGDVTISCISKPHFGADMMDLEVIRHRRDRLCKTDKDGNYIMPDPDSPEGMRWRVQNAEYLVRLMAYQLYFPGHEKLTAEERRAASFEKVSALPAPLFTALSKANVEAQREMEHGLPSVLVDGQLNLIMPPHVCPVKAKEGAERSTVLHTPFRYVDYLPNLH